MAKQRRKRLFISGANKDMDVDLSKIRNQGSYSFWDYGQGYFLAAENLANAMVATRQSLPIQTYPLLYLYRHAIELCLKHFGTKMQLAFGRYKQFRKSHYLIDVWRVIRPYIRHLPSPGNEPRLISFANEVIRQFTEIDPYGEEFRFPYSLKGELHLKNTDSINLEALTISMNRLRRCFDIWEKATDDFIEAEIQRGIDELEEDLEIQELN